MEVKQPGASPSGIKLKTKLINKASLKVLYLLAAPIKMKSMNKSIITSLLLLLFLPGYAQKELMLTLDDALLLAQTQSLQAFLDKNYFLEDYWDYKIFKAGFLPSLTFDSDALSYNNSSSLYYNSSTQSYEFARTETMTSDASLYITQDIAATGGSLYVNTDLTRYQNYGDYNYVQYSSTPLSIGYTQDLFAYNSFKWDKKIEPKEYEKAKREYIESVEEMNGMTVEYFFQLALDEREMKLAEYNYHKTDTLLQIAEKRFLIGSQTRDEVLDLKLSKNNNYINWQEAKLSLRKSRDELLNFLMLPKDISIKVVLPGEVPDLVINATEALKQALNNNPTILEQEISILEAKEEVAEAKADNRFSADVSLYYGISKDDGRYDYTNDKSENGEIANVYKSDFEDYQVVSLDVTIPILDWGQGKGYVEIAKSAQRVAEISAQKALQEFELNTITQALEFNIQREKVASAAFSDSLAQESYQLTVTRFKKGQVDVLKLVSSQTAKDNAEVQYISALQDYWESYYGMRELTLYDFENNQSLDAAFDAIIKNR